MTGVWLENGGSVGLNLVLVNGLAWAEMHMHLTALEVGEWGRGGGGFLRYKYRVIILIFWFYLEGLQQQSASPNFFEVSYGSLID